MATAYSLHPFRQEWLCVCWSVEAPASPGPTLWRWRWHRGIRSRSFTAASPARRGRGRGASGGLGPGCGARVGAASGQRVGRGGRLLHQRAGPARGGHTDLGAGGPIHLRLQRLAYADLARAGCTASWPLTEPAPVHSAEFEVCALPAENAWVDGPWLEGQGIDPWSEMPLWTGNDTAEYGFCRVNGDKALAEGLVLRGGSHPPRHPGVGAGKSARWPGHRIGSLPRGHTHPSVAWAL